MSNSFDYLIACATIPLMSPSPCHLSLSATIDTLPHIISPHIEQKPGFKYANKQPVVKKDSSGTTTPVSPSNETKRMRVVGKKKNLANATSAASAPAFSATVGVSSSLGSIGSSSHILSSATPVGDPKSTGGISDTGKDSLFCCCRHLNTDPTYSDTSPLSFCSISRI